MIDQSAWELFALEQYLLRPIDRLLVARLADALPQACGADGRESFIHGVQMLCAALNRGDTFLPLDRDTFPAACRNWLGTGGEAVRAGGIEEFCVGRLERFCTHLDKNEFAAVVAEAPAAGRPLVHDRAGKRLYFERYFRAVHTINAALACRFGPFPFDLPSGGDVNLVKNLLAGIPPGKLPDGRQTAALLCGLRNKTLVVSGGPGTGKTFVVLQLLRLLLRALPWLEAEDIRLAAPTGRAAARLQESIAAGLREAGQGKRDGEADRDSALESVRATTVHRLLEYNPSTVSFGRSADNPVAAAVVVVDEVSMLDIELFGRLLDALTQKCVLILLGDRFQLPPVEAGAVLGDLTSGFDREAGDSLSAATVLDVKKIMAPGLETDIEAAAGSAAHVLRDRAVILTSSHRSAQAIQELALAINRNQQALTLLEPPSAARACAWKKLLGDIPPEGRRIWIECGPAEDPFSVIEGWIERHFGPAYEQVLAHELIDGSGRPTPNAQALIEEVLRSRVLTVVREGLRGAAVINRKCCAKLWRALDPAGTADLFHGMPVMIRSNAPGLDLYNGDCGVMVRCRDGGFAAIFRNGNGCVARRSGVLPEWEPAFAMTVHKSQGSEYDRVLLVLPAAINPLCTREILYTAVTRARRVAAIAGPRAVLERGLERIISRNTGIRL